MQYYFQTVGKNRVKDVVSKHLWGIYGYLTNYNHFVRLRVEG